MAAAGMTASSVTAPSSAVSLLHLAGNKLRQTLGSQMNESSSLGASEFAKKQLEKLGWKEGQGLGKRKQGMASHIQVKKRAEGVGLGESTLDPAIHQSLSANNWWKHSVGDTLAKLAKKNKSKKTTKKSSKRKESSSNNQEEITTTTTTNNKIYTDDELFQATGGVRFGMRAQTQQRGKWKRAESNISEQEEQDARRKVEWDGMKAPVVLLTVNAETKPKTVVGAQVEQVSSSNNNNKDETKEKKRKARNQETEEERAERKRRKKEKKQKRNEEGSSFSSSSEQASKKPSKKSKKQKRS